MYCEIYALSCLGIVFMSHFVCVSTSTLPINWTLATFTNLVLERQYTYPAYNEVAPSPCDLTQNFCDIFCCSDVDCSLEDLSSFPCREPAKAVAATLEDLLSCDSSQQQPPKRNWDRPPWFSLFCYVSSNTPLLGRFFDLRPSFTSLAAMKEVVSPLETFSFGPVDLPPSAEPGYRYGRPVRIFWRNSEVPDSDDLRVPRNALSGRRCGKDLPVGYLVNLDAVCVDVVTRRRCEEGSALGGLRYAVASTAGRDDDDDQRFDVVEEDDGRLVGLPSVSADGVGTSSPVDTATEFFRFCNGSDHLTFSRSLSGDEKRRLQNNDSASCEYGFEEVDDPGQSLLTWFDEPAGICRNVVTSVEYRFVWKGPLIKKLTASYTLVDVPTSLAAGDGGLGQDATGDRELFVPVVDGDLTFFVTRKFSVSFQYETPNVTSGEDGTAASDGGNTTSAATVVSFGEKTSAAPTSSSADNRHGGDGLFSMGSPVAEDGEGNGTDGYLDKSGVYMWSGGE